jgi:carbamoyltransferase
MYILGLNSYHADASACIVSDGMLIAAAEEERFNRIKHWAGFPCHAIKYCLDEAGISIDAVDHIAINRNPKANLVRKAVYTFSKRPSLKNIFNRLSNAGKIRDIKEAIYCAFNIGPGALKAKMHYIEHHRAHIASAFFVSPFDAATVISVDGFGDFVSTMWGQCEGRSIKINGQVNFPHSLGMFYLALTQFLGFNHYGDEYKVMGLAPYGKAQYMDAMGRIVKLKQGGAFELGLNYFRHHSEGVSMVWDNGAPRLGQVFSLELERLLGPAKDENDPFTQRHFDIAASLQKMYENVFFHILKYAYKTSLNPNLCLAGGCAMNSAANGKIFKHSNFKELYIQSAAGDGGGAIGAAFYLWHNKLKAERTYHMAHAYLGPEFSNDQIVTMLTAKRSIMAAKGCQIKEIRDEKELCSHVAEHIATGKVVGWFQGRMEWGPRALGNRSILCDPRNPEMKKVLNAKIKRRESFRPFAPAIVREAMAEWFETDYDVPFMLQIYQIRPEKQKLIPAVVHVNGSGRPQTVTCAQNQLYYRLLKAFEARTGIPIVLNTSFNENEPVVCRPEEALNCFLRTRMDLVVIGNWVISQY